MTMVERWRLEGTIFDACNCITLCPCGYFQPPSSGTGDCRVSFAWRIEKGNFGATKLDGLTAAAVVFAKGNPLFGVEKIAWMVDEKATTTQRETLTKIFTGQAGGIWAVVAKLVKDNLGITYAHFDYDNDGKSWSVRAGTYPALALDVKAGFVKAPPGAPVGSAPKRAQTYDSFYSPSMEKVVGITDTYRANIAGLNYDFSGRYSGSGRFRYEGP